MMSLLIYFALFAVSQAEILAIKDSIYNNVVNFNDVQYEKETLVEGYGMPYQLAIDPATNTLFFSYSTLDTKEPFKSVYLDLDSKQHGIITGIKCGFAHAVDVKNNIVYLGSSDSGLYKFDYSTKKAIPLNLSNDNIWQMFFKDHLYYTTYPDEKTYVIKNEAKHVIKELENSKTLLIALDNKYNMYFSNYTGMYTLRKEDGIISKIGDFLVNAFSTDSKGNLFFSTPTGIYSVNAENLSVKNLLNTNEVFGLAIENNNNILYATSNSIVRLKSTAGLSTKN